MFFTYESNLPENVGFSLFSPEHLGVLAVVVIVALFVARWAKGKNAVQRRRDSHLAGILILAIDILRYVVYWFMGGLNIYELPLHLCGMAVYLCALHGFWKTDGLGQILYTLCLPGACCALLFPDWTSYPFFSFASLHGFAAHALLVWYIIAQTASGQIRPRLSAIWKPCLFLCCAVPPVFWFNVHFSANYLFLQIPSAGSPLVALSRIAGGSHAGYLILFAIVVVGIMILADLLFYLFAKFRRGCSLITTFQEK